MKTIKNSTAGLKLKSSVITIGNFDGLHLGHQKIIKKVVERAKKLGCPSIVYTFEPHPLKVVAPQKSPALILDKDDKARLIEKSGVDFLVLAKFTKSFASRHPKEFVKENLVSQFGIKEAWVGHDFAFGKGKSGTVDYLKTLGAEFGFKVFVVPVLKKGPAIVSSSRIRELIKKGEVEKAAKLLGRLYSIKGKVVKGKSIGKEIGFPTANISTGSELIPADGVYAAFTFLDGKKYSSVVNIGIAPTFGKRQRAIEAHIFKFKDNIYGKKIEAVFVKRLRGEKAFSSREALTAQIKKDGDKAKRILSGYKKG